MDDLISRSELKNKIASMSMPWDFVDAINTIAAINTFIDEAPVVDAIPVVQFGEKKKFSDKNGKWIPLGHIIGSMNHPWSEYFKCSLCGYEHYTLFDLPPDECPNCGAKMILEQEGDNEAD